MKIIVYPSDDFGCGHHRLIWPAEVLQAQGHDITVVRSMDRHVRMHFENDKLIDVKMDGEYDVAVFQRLTDRRVVDMIDILRDRGIAVVIDVDDDLNTIHPDNPAWYMLNPNRARLETEIAVRGGRVPVERRAEYQTFLEHKYTHSWNTLTDACKRATLVTASTYALLGRYAAHGRGMVLDNFTPDHYLQVVHEDSDLIGWPATLHSHPNDPAAVGNSILRVVQEGATFGAIGGTASADNARAFGLGSYAPLELGEPELDTWPQELTKLGIAIAPLADTRFNAAKSWLKPLECAAVGVPVVMSPSREYLRLHDDYGIGVVATKPKDWYRALRDLQADVPRRLEASLAGREGAARLALSANAWRHLEAWETALKIQRRTGPKDTTSPGQTPTVRATAQTGV